MPTTRFWAALTVMVFGVVCTASAQHAPTAYEIDVALDAVAAVLHGRETIRFANPTGRPLDELRLHLYANAYENSKTVFARDRQQLASYENPLTAIPSADRGGSITVQNIRVNGMPADFTVVETLLRIRLAAPLQGGEAVTVDLRFEVRIPRYRDRLAVERGNFVIGAWFPKVAVVDGSGWHATERRGLGEFHSDIANYDVSITVPTGTVVGSTGTNVERTVNPDRTETSRWKAERIRDFAWAADARYRTTETLWNNVRLTYLSLTADERTVANGLRLAVEALRYFGERYGAYPYPTFTIAEAAAVESGVGIEYPQLVLLSEDFSRLSGFSSAYETVLVHEIAHQWWYGLVGNNEVDEAWLDEALASYSTRTFLRHKYGADPPMFRWPQMLRFLPSTSEDDLSRLMYVSQARAGFDRPVQASAAEFDDRQSYVVSVYYKGAYVLEMLEYLVGSDTFDAILRRYSHEYAYRIARSTDFIRTAEAVSDRDLTTFFTQWLNGTGTCDYSVEALDVRQAGEIYESTITVRRRGDIVMPVEVEARFANGEFERRTWDGRAEEGRITFRGSGPVHSAQLDPDRRLLETDVENNTHPRRRKVSLNPFSMPADAYTAAWLPIAWYDDGYEVGGLMIAGGAPEIGFPYGVRRRNHVRVSFLRNVSRDTNKLRLSYGTPVDAIGPRGSAGITLSLEPGDARAGLHLQWLHGEHFFRAPTHTVELSALHERQTAHPADDRNREPFDAGIVRSVKTRYVFNRLTTDYYPLHGQRVDASVEVGILALGSDWGFARATVRADTYRPLTSRAKLAISAFHGVLWGDEPRQRRFSLTRDANFVLDDLNQVVVVRAGRIFDRR